ncbi:MAG: S41 family peptidase [Patescibacteria group bacterium]|nr:S41 family peptidase [Patescibacteria group bacterium]
MKLRKALTIFFLLIFILTDFGLGFYLGKTQCKICPPEEIDFSLFWEAYHKLQEKFVSPEKLDVQKMIYGAISGMVKSLNDPYTIFLNPEETKEFLKSIKGEVFEGVGMEIGIRKGQLQVIAPLEGTPAQKAGLRTGDKIIKINDTLTAEITIEEAVSLIRGPKGTEVTLTILREGWQEPKEFKIKRAMIKVPTLKKELKDENIVYLKLYQFSEELSSDFGKAAIEILDSPAQKIVLDLRNNPGGLLEEAEAISGWFLERGQTVVIVEGKKREEHKAEGNERFVDYPIVVLINQGTASGAEILAAALRDNRGAIIIGETSFGKGLVQEPERLRDGSILKITTAKWLTPKGQSITGVGIEPDILVEMTEKDYEEGRDPQLEKAIEVIKEL